MGYFGKLDEKLKAQGLRRQGLSYKEILLQINVSKDTLSNWCRDIELTKKQKEFAKNFLRRYNLKKSDFIVGINTGAGPRWPLKSLPIEKTAEVIEKFNELRRIFRELDIDEK